MGNHSDQRGFSLVETLLGLMLIGVAALALGSTMKILFTGTHTATMKAVDTDLRAAVVQALSNGATCKQSLQIKPGSIVTPGSGKVPVSIVDSSVPGGQPVIADGQNLNGVLYNVTLNYPSHLVTIANDVTFPAGNGRATSTTRYLAEIELQANRNAKATLGSLTTMTYVPVFIELDTTNKIVSCGSGADEEDEALYWSGSGPQHTVRDCMVAGGVPYPTDIGLLCRFPVFVRNTGTSTGPTQPTPSCSATWTTVAGWRDPPGAIYTSTRATDFHYTACTNKSKFVSTGYHYLGPYPVESASFVQQSGTGDNTNWSWKSVGITMGSAAGATAGAVGLGYMTLFAASSAFGPAGLIVAGIVFVIFSVTNSSCHSDPAITVYAQPIAVGCY